MPEDSTFLFIASPAARQREAISAYANRRLVEALFGCCLESRGFDLKTLIDPMDVSVFRAQAVMFDADFVPHLIQ
ncbi:transposase [Methylocaldum marinum]|uniref:Transposase n=1 Tax=Methylocaldum marinum TaxID=1432792 RepID=A0A250KMP2_9GAMM|nr:hypothetical protein [Methylocaldum marinum]BBA32826.1 transposase [Methylocaldum marinum]